MFKGYKLNYRAAGPALFRKNPLLSHDIQRHMASNFDLIPHTLLLWEVHVWWYFRKYQEPLCEVGKRWLMTVQLPKLLANFEVYYYTISPSINILFLRSTYSQRRSKQREKIRVLLNEFTAKLIWFWQFGAFKMLGLHFWNTKGGMSNNNCLILKIKSIWNIFMHSGK